MIIDLCIVSLASLCTPLPRTYSQGGTFTSTSFVTSITSGTGITDSYTFTFTFTRTIGSIPPTPTTWTDFSTYTTTIGTDTETIITYLIIIFETTVTTWAIHYPIIQDQHHYYYYYYYIYETMPTIFTTTSTYTTTQTTTLSTITTTTTTETIYTVPTEYQVVPGYNGFAVIIGIALGVIFLFAKKRAK